MYMIFGMQSIIKQESVRQLHQNTGFTNYYKWLVETMMFYEAT